MRDLAFVRSPVAHARIRSVRKPSGFEASVFVAADLTGVQPIVAVSGLPGFKPSVQPVLADTKCAMSASRSPSACAQPCRGRGYRRPVEIDFEELPPWWTCAPRSPPKRGCTITGQ